MEADLVDVELFGESTSTVIAGTGNPSPSKVFRTVTPSVSTTRSVMGTTSVSLVYPGCGR
jgi:hypothetical protein